MRLRESFERLLLAVSAGASDGACAESEDIHSKTSVTEGLEIKTPAYMVCSGHV